MRIVLLCTFIDSISKSITGLPQASCQTFPTLCRNLFNSYNCRYREALWERSVFPKNATKWPGQVLNPRTLRARVQHAKNYATTSTTQGTYTNMEFVFFSTVVCSHHVTHNPRGKERVIRDVTKQRLQRDHWERLNSPDWICQIFYCQWVWWVQKCSTERSKMVTSVHDSKA